MEVTIKKLTPALWQEFLEYFDHAAFSDHEEWSACYCLESHLSEEENNNILTEKADRREKAAELIRSGVMEGYLACVDGRVAGWCNSGDKLHYGPLCAKPDYRTEGDGAPGTVKIVYCMDIGPAYRGQGLAGCILDRICEDAKAEGFRYVEGYPFSDRERPWQFHGPARLYESRGFQLYEARGRILVMRREL